MKMIVLFLFVFISGVFAGNANSQETKVSISKNNKPIREILGEIERQTDYLFVYSEKEVDVNQRKTVNVSQQRVADVLSSLFRSTNVGYAMEGHNIMLMAKTTQTDAAQQKRHITGVVKDIKGETIIGANIMIKGTGTGVSTNIDGGFSIEAATGDELIVSFIGYLTQTIKIDSQKTLNIKLLEDTKTLEEVVVVGYTVQTKSAVTGSVAVVKADKLKDVNTLEVGSMLQGKVSGVYVSGSSGEPGQASKIRIRGKGTLNSSVSPLWVVDGVIVGEDPGLNPNEIDNISVLKDGSATALYGSRAANGVIVVTTKRGEYDANKYSVSVNAGVSLLSTGHLEMMNSQELYDYQKSWNNQSWFTEELLKHNTDWFKEFYKNWVPSTEHNLNISGGTDKLTYMISGSFLDQKGLLRHGEDQFNRYTMNAKISAKLTDWVTLNYTSKWTREDYDRPTYMTGLFFHNIARRWPTCPVRDPNGHYQQKMEIIEMEDGGKQTSQKNWYTQQLQAIFEPIKDWRIVAEGSMRTYTRKQSWAVLPIYAYDADNQPYLLGWGDNAAGYSEVQDSRESEDYFSTNIYTDFAKTFGDHNFKIMVGFNGELYRPSGLTGFGTDLISPEVPSLGLTQDNKKASSWASEKAIAGFFGRLNYNYKERYMLEANLRYDGSSRFIGDKRWGLFPSFSAGWNISREAFFEPLTQVVGTLKLRGSWGQLGNNNTSETNAWYPFYQNMPTGSASSGWLINGKKQNVAGLPGIVSSLMTWETIESWNVGIDWGLFDNRLTGSFDYYNRYTYDMIGPAPTLPSVLGASAPQINNCDMKSYGWELELSWRDRIQQFNYGVRLVMSDNMQKILEYPNKTLSLGEKYYTGKTIGEIWGYKTIGIAQTQEEMDKHLANGGKPNWGSAWGAGDIMYANIDGKDGVNSGANTVNDHGDLKIIGNSTPRYNFGLTLDGSWKGLDFSLFIQGVMKRDYMLDGPYFWGANGGMWQSCVFKEHLDYWRPEGDPLGANTNAYYPKPYFSSNKNQKTQSGYLQNAAYCRLKNAQIGYTLPKAWTKKAAMESVRVYVSGDNLLTISGISDIFDPETLGGDWGPGKLYPLQRTISIGLNVNF